MSALWFGPGFPDIHEWLLSARSGRSDERVSRELLAGHLMRDQRVVLDVPCAGLSPSSQPDLLQLEKVLPRRLYGKVLAAARASL